MAGRRSIALAGVVGVIVGCGATVGVALSRGDDIGAVDRPSVEESSAPITVPLTRQVVVDSEILSGQLSWADTVLTVATAGVVTAMPVADGAGIKNGQIVLEVNGRPIVALHMRFGLWRDLALDDEGADVRELHTALSELKLYDGALDAPMSPATFDALGKIDPRLGGDSLTIASVAAIDASGSTLAAPGIEIGSTLGEQTVGVRRQSHRISVDDGGMAGQFVKAGQGIELYDDNGASSWSGSVAEVVTEDARTLLTVSGEGDLPADFTTASVTVTASKGEVLAAPRVAITPQPDGSSTITVVDAAGKKADVTVRTGLCAADLCEITPEKGDGSTEAVEGALVVVP